MKRNGLRTLIVPFLSLIFFVSSSLAAEGVAGIGTVWKVQHTGTIVAGYRTSSVPFSFTTAIDSTPTGFTIDICRHVVDAIRLAAGKPDAKLIFVDAERPDRLARLVSGELDLECGETTVQDPRLQHVGVSVPIFQSETRLLVTQESQYHSFGDLYGKRLAYTAGTIAEEFLIKREAQGNLLVENVAKRTDIDSLNAVVSGEVDAWYMPDLTAMILLAKGAGQDRGFRIIGEGVVKNKVVIAIRRDDVEMKKIVDETIANLTTSGEFENIYNKWFMSPIQPFGFNVKYRKRVESATAASANSAPAKLW
jgi:ABC-type amino acid transport substrate-binding protein